MWTVAHGSRDLGLTDVRLSAAGLKNHATPISRENDTVAQISVRRLNPLAPHPHNNLAKRQTRTGFAERLSHAVTSGAAGREETWTSPQIPHRARALC